MMNRKRIILAVMFASICSWCWAGAETEWPADVSKNMYIPPAARDITYNSSHEVFRVSYRANICYPAKSMMKAASDLMGSRGWDRMIYDPLNPGTKLPPDYPGSDKSWLGFYPWNSYWKDGSGNVVAYEYSYEVNETLSPIDYFEAVRRSCSLIGSVIYRSSDAYKKMIKTTDEMKKRRQP
jgi:hypothetical protein